LPAAARSTSAGAWPWEGALTNSGTVNWLAGNVYLDTCTSNSAGPMVNLGQWNIQSGQSALSCSAGTNAYFTNAGTVLKTNDTGTTSFAIPFNNSGTLQVDTGTLELMNGGVLDGLFVAKTNTAIDFEGGNFTLDGAAPAGSGPGQVQFTGINANITCIGPMSGVLNCSLATIAGPLTIAHNGTLNITGIGVALNSPLTNSGTVNWLSGVVFLNTLYFPLAGPVVNLAGGLWNIQSDQAVSANIADAVAYFTNAGTVLKTNSTGTTTFWVPFFNSGTVQADTGTILFNNGYAETSSANLLISLSGPAPAAATARFSSTTRPLFAGALSVNTRNGYQPAPGAVFHRIGLSVVRGRVLFHEPGSAGRNAASTAVQHRQPGADRCGIQCAAIVHLLLRRQRDDSVDARFLRLGAPIRHEPYGARLDAADRDRQSNRRAGLGGAAVFPPA